MFPDSRRSERPYETTGTHRVHRFHVCSLRPVVYPSTIHGKEEDKFRKMNSKRSFISFLSWVSFHISLRIRSCETRRGKGIDQEDQRQRETPRTVEDLPISKLVITYLRKVTTGPLPLPLLRLGRGREYVHCKIVPLSTISMVAGFGQERSTTFKTLWFKIPWRL